MLDPVIACEAMMGGWRGLTEHGEVLNVKSESNIAPIGTDLLVFCDKKAVGRREVRNDYEINIDDYLAHYDLGLDLFKRNKLEEALRELNLAIDLAPTTGAKFNKSLVLLSMGRWKEGLELYEARTKMGYWGLCKDLKIPMWRGQSPVGKRLLLVHDAGYGDTIQQFRYIPHLRALGAEVILLLPPELQRLGNQLAPLGQDADFYCPMLSLLYMLEQTIETIPSRPYLKVNRRASSNWRKRLGSSSRKKIGVAWQVGRLADGDFPRSIELDDLVAALPNAELYSIQQHVSDCHGITSFQFSDFADCAALISVMDEIVTIDTAAAHLAGAIGHPNVTVLLSHWASWRWVGNPFYPWFKLLRQERDGDWSTVLRQLQ